MIKDFIRKITPMWIRRRYWKFILKRAILKYYKGESISKDKLAVINYLKKNSLHVYPYPFRENYSIKNSPEVVLDSECNMNYVLIDDKYRLYFKQGLSKKKVKKLYSDMIMEQDELSPHCYKGQNFQIEAGDIVFDVGTCEGLWLLKHIEQISQAYIFEYNPEWIAALNKTFSPWKGKVIITPKFVCDIDNNNSITIDSFTKENGIKNIDFLKIDVEGAERDVLKGADNLLSKKCISKIAVCTYHRHDDEKVIKEILLNHRFDVSFSNGYMIFHDDPKIKPPYFRKALIRAKLK